MVVLITTASKIPGILEVTRSLLDSDHGEEALLESYTRNLHAIGEHHLDQATWSDYHDKGESDNDYIIMEKDDDDNIRRPGGDDDNFLISEQRRHTNIRVARSQKGKTKQWPELGIGKVSS